MPIKNIFLDDKIGLLRVGEGILTANEVIEANNEALSKEILHKNLLYIFVDLTNNTHLEASSDDIERIARSDSKIFTASNNVVIAISANKDLIYALARMWQAYSDNYDFYHCVERNLSKAEDWLISKVKEVHGIDITRPLNLR